MTGDTNMAWNVLILAATLFQSVVKIQSDIVFPNSGKIELETPAQCKNGAHVCGGDDSEYPLQKIKQIIDNAVELRNTPENMKHFFSELEEMPEEQLIDDSLQDLEPACKSRTEMIPPRARAMNIAKKWVYLVEVADRADLAGKRSTQQVEVNICEDVDQPCKNNVDSPVGGSTVCKQLFRTQKLLAINKDGEIVVDTFELPSACICNYRRSSDPIELSNPFALRNPFDGFGFDDSKKSAKDETEPSKKEDILRAFDNIICNGTHNVSEPLKTRYFVEEEAITFEKRNSMTGRLERYQSISLVPKEDACIKYNTTTNLCLEHDDYPTSQVKMLLRGTNTLRSPIHFQKLFDRPCEIEKPLTTLRVGFNIDEQPLCDSYQSYIYPKVGKNIHGKWRYIINIDEYQQGVSVEICNERVKDKACKYGGKDGMYPDVTICKQLQSRHNMLTVSREKGVAYETFLFPSACVCHLKNSFPTDDYDYDHRLPSPPFFQD